MAIHIQRREFITLLGGAVAAWPLAARAQQIEGMRRIGLLMNLAADDPESPVRLAALMQGLQELGWINGRNVRLEVRWGAGDGERYRKHAAELVSLRPDLIFASAGAVMPALLQATRSVPIVFVNALDPVGAGFVVSLAKPGGNATGFTNFEFGMSGKWLELLKQIAPAVRRVGVLRDAARESGIGQWAAIQAVAPAFGVELRPLDVRDAAEIERAISAFATMPDSGLIVAAGAPAAIHRDTIIAMALRHRLPTTYPYRYFITGGGLICYGPDVLDPYRRAAAYVDRILKGEKPADLPVQAPTKYELVINLKTAKLLAIDVPASLLARADEVIE